MVAELSVDEGVRTIAAGRGHGATASAADFLLHFHFNLPALSTLL